MTIHLIAAKEYGMWLTLSSIISWGSFFDIGITNGLRNKLAVAIAKGDTSLARAYVSTATILVALIMSLAAIALYSVNPLINWTATLNTESSYGTTLSIVALIAGLGFCISFFFKIIGVVYLAHQRSAMIDLLGMIGQFGILVSISFMSLFGGGNLVTIALAFSLIPVVPYVFAFGISFSKKYSEIRPTLKDFKLSLVQNILGLGFFFFIIQVSSLVVFTLSNVLIAQLFGPAEVTKYNVASKYFSVVIVAFGVILSPFWSASTDAYTRKDMGWISRAIQKLWFILLAMTGCVILLIFLSDQMYRIWVGPTILIPKELTISIGVVTVITCWNSLYSNFLAGSGKMMLSSILCVFNIVVFVPVAILSAKWFGLSGIVLTTGAILLVGGIQVQVQVSKIRKGSAHGIWAR